MSSNDLIRMSGMNSGLDTESIIKALTANSKLKITKQERNVLKYEAQQEAYRDVISKLTSLKDKYFNILNKDTNLTGTSMWNKYAAKTYNPDGQEQAYAGVNITTTLNSNPGDYKVKVTKTASQAAVKGSSLSSSAKIDSDAIDSMEEGSEYGMSFTVGEETKNITFTGGANREETLKNINDALSEAFGDSNRSAAAKAAGGAQTLEDSQGMIYVDQDGQIHSREGKGLAVSGAGEMKSSNVLDYSDPGKGGNTLTIQAGDETFNVSFQTVSNDMFDLIFKKDDSGNFITDSDGMYVRKTDEELEAEAQALKDGTPEGDQAYYERYAAISEAKLYDSVKEDYIEKLKYEEYKQWSETASDEDKELLKDQAFARAEADNEVKQMNKWLSADSDMNQKYVDYLNEERSSQIKNTLNSDSELAAKYIEYRNEAGSEALDIDEWARTSDDTDVYAKWQSASDGVTRAYDDIYSWAQHSTDSEVADKVNELTNKYNGTDYTEEALDRFLQKQYSAYKSETESEGGEVQDYEIWKSNNFSEGDTSNELYSSFIEENSWHLDKEGWSTITYHEFSSFKEEGWSTIDASQIPDDTQTMVDHMNESNLKNALAGLESKNGVKFSAELENGQMKITAEDRNGAPVQFSVSAGENNKSDFGVAQATKSISQISNSTTISDLGLEADENGNYNVTINDVNFSFSSDTTVKDMMKQINASSAGVKLSYSSLQNSFSMTANEYGTGGRIDISGDSQNLFRTLGLTDGAEVTAGSNLKVEINGTEYESNGNSIEADGSTFTFNSNMKEGTEFSVTVEKDTSAIADTLKQFIEDYNKVIDDVYKLLEEKPDDKYYFLADADKEDLALSEKQEEKWEEKAKLGIIYHDSTVSNVMTKLRTSLMGVVTGADGEDFALASMGIVTETDYKEHGKLKIADENKLMNAIRDHSDDIAKLFTDNDNGIMKAFSAALDGGVKSTGENKGTLVLKAGLATGSTATDNRIFEMIKRTKSRISSLTTRYESEQDRLWKKYSSMEKLMGTMNQQQTSMMSYFGQA